jgi:hypothetical protein
VTVLVATFDAVRGRVLRVTMRVPVARRVFTDARLRIPIFGVVAVSLGAAAAATAPLVLLWLSAALFGVPHVVSGLRHVAVLREARRNTKLFTGLGVALGAAQLLGAGDWSARGFVVLFSLSAFAELALHRSTWRAKLIAVAVAVAATAGVVWPLPALLVLSHLHAVSSLAFVAQRARERRIVIWPVIAVVTAVAAAGALGAFDALLAGPLLAPRSAMDSITAEAVGSALGHPSAVLFRRALFLYAFGQSVHFTSWLKLVPELDRPSTVPQSLRVTLARFRAELGAWAIPAIVLCVAASAAMLLGGGIARETYFALTYAHLGLEGAVVLGAAACVRS